MMTARNGVAFGKLGKLQQPIRNVRSMEWIRRTGFRRWNRRNVIARREGPRLKGSSWFGGDWRHLRSHSGIRGHGGRWRCQKCWIGSGLRRQQWRRRTWL
ncbi:hypothetical protein CsatB_009457 [Cannabis sativa]